MQSASGGNFLQKVHHALRLDQLTPGVRRLIVGIVGGIVLVIGLALLVLPGPAFVVIPLGLAILASEFTWARNYLNKARDWINKVRRKKKNRKAP